MATPTASAKPTPGQAHAPFTPTASSPTTHPHAGNKSVRSPVSHMKRSRADTLRGMEQSSSTQGIGTPRAGQPGSSPGFLGTPGQTQGGPGLGISISTPGGGAGTPGGAAMQRGGSTSFGLSSLGIDASLLNADREAYAKSRIAIIKDMIGQKWGLVSRVGVQQCAARLRLESLWETGENEETGILDLAGDGNGVFLQITFKGEAVKDTQLSFPTPEGSAKAKDPEDEKRGGIILKKDLQGWQNEQDRGFYVELNHFGQNMQHLAEIDHLSKGGISCFEAIDGIYKSLKEVEGWWKKRNEEQGELDILAKGVGWPRLHANGRVGVRLDYWLHQWQVNKRTQKKGFLDAPTVRNQDLFGMRIGVAPLNPGTFITPIRNTSDWFSFLDDMPIDDGAGSISTFPPLQLQRKEPDPTYLPSSEVSQADDNGNPLPGAVPNIMFRASFDPPLPISYSAASSLLGQSNEAARSYAKLLYPSAHIDEQSRQFSLNLSREVFYPPEDSYKSVNFRLSSANLMPAFLLQELPFSHPHELLSMLPILRQWAWLQKVITSGMGVISSRDVNSQKPLEKQASTKKKPKKDLSAKEVRAILKAGGTWQPTTDSEDESDEDARPPKLASSHTVDVSLELPPPMLAANPVQGPDAGVKLSIIIPVGEDSDPVMAQFSLLPGPRLVAAGPSSEDEFAKRMAKVLEGCEDVGVLVLWVRREKKQEKSSEDEDMTDG